ncbi:MAG: NAD(P)/FAD-dependent oxidoreductase, partial [Candidatus Moranbacteria bacterium]|nr:NAD(P)/FAD-dependent oxidoreductase [Candidatus Moranbacteria bacterium]
NWKEILKRKTKIVKRLTGGVKLLLEKNGLDIYIGAAQVVSSTVVRVNEDELQTAHLILATGASPMIPNIKGLKEELSSGHAKTSKEILDIDEIPDRLVIIGGGVIGIEFATLFSTFGTNVKIIERESNILQGIDFWTCWSGDSVAGGFEDPVITNEKSFFDSLSVKCEDQNNFLLKFGEIIQGKYALSFKLFIPNGFTGYYNILQSKDTITNEIVKGLEIFFNPNGIATINYESSTSSAEFNFEYDTWFEMQHFIDLNYDIASVYYNTDEIHKWQWSAGASDEGGVNKLFAANFFANPTNGTPQYFIDDVVFALLEPPIGFAEINSAPDQFNFELKYTNSDT